MRKSTIIAVLFSLFTCAAFSQLSPQDKLALQIPAEQTYSTTGISSYVKNNFSTDSARVRALFVWVANNIRYDVEKIRLKKIQERTTVQDVLKTRMGVCQGYAELLVALNKACNINSVLVPGYTKKQDGSIAELSHAWVATEVNSKWYLFDPTWAAGMVNDFKFTPTFSNRYYKLAPEEMIKDHMPFDPMYQFLNHTLSYNEFNRGNTGINTGKPYFNYVDTINTYNRMDSLDQFINTARRISKNGEKNQMILDMVQVLNKNQTSGESKIGFEGAVAEYKRATELFNKYIDHKNKRFSLIKDNRELEQMIDGVLEHFNAAKAMIEPVVAMTEDQKRSLASFNSNFYNFYRRVDEEKIFVKNYIKNNKAAGN